jgi:hypothetical protein
MARPLDHYSSCQLMELLVGVVEDRSPSYNFLLIVDQLQKGDSTFVVAASNQSYLLRICGLLRLYLNFIYVITLP